MSGIGFHHHDHAVCVAGALQAAEDYCARNKLQLTKVRRRVLEILLAAHRAMGAYDILAQLAREGLGSQPPVAYRALDFLVSNGFAHKIETLNAYVACSLPGAAHSPAFMICRVCGAVVEAPTSPQAGRLGEAARDLGFAIETAVMEAEGLCPTCRDHGAAE
ncbi:Fur family transcriptional regulator [Pseudoruegeria sp. SK021]|uniref:Fur family transcriptional regulator n=1 Tax=Pseudoruegeria sp. SK021 TaxID=1933035 RepID=UPI000A239739|nr:Fur family transcriptional regulator [Pseudoruegeria sp. SK021]OSP54039.1 Fur family transcriptional regulator [Pseudoruegeria sp. SK021]